jgi:hypothetical protein
VGARHLLCSSHSFELEIHLHHPHRFLNRDYIMFDCGGVALSEDKLRFSWEGDRPGLERVGYAPSWRCWVLRPSRQSYSWLPSLSLWSVFSGAQSTERKLEGELPVAVR